MNLSTAVFAVGASFIALSVNATAYAIDGETGRLSKDDVFLAQGTSRGSRNELFGDDLPRTEKPKASSRDELFGTEPPKSKPAKPDSRDALFGDESPKNQPSPADGSIARRDPGESGAAGWRGFVQTEFAYTYENPDHWSKARARLELGRQGRLADSVKYKVTGRVDYDAVFDIERNFYPEEVERDQRRDFQWRETYVDVSAGDFQFRVGRQHIIWGEVPGLFFADVVSAKDMREFLLPEFDGLRIPQWAVRAEYFAADAHLELIWIPWVTADRIGKPGADFFPYPPPPPPGYDAAFKGEEKPDRSLSDTNFGFRASTLQGGWDMSAFVYRATDVQANFYRRVVNAPVPTFVFTPRHDRITQVGGTLAKDLGSLVLKAEAIYSHDKGFSVERLSHPDGVAKLDIFDYLIGADFTLGRDTRLYAYGFQRRFLDYDEDIVPDRNESGVTLQVSHKIASTVELQALFIASLNRSDWTFRPRVTWNFAKNWRMNAGLDVLHGPPLGFFGQFANKDRAYADVRYSF